MKKAFLSAAVLFLSVALFAQDADSSELESEITTGAGAWYASPWVWVLGAAVFIILLVALTKGNNRNKT